MQYSKVNFSILTREEMESIAVQMQATIIELTSTLGKAMAMIADLKRQNESLKNMVYGHTSECCINDGTPMIPGLELPEPAKQSEDEAKAKVKGHDRNVAKPQRNAGWNEFPEHLPREEVIIDLPDAEKQGLVLIGHSTSECLVRRCEYYVRVTKRAKYATPGRKGLGVEAPDPFPNVLPENSDRARYDITVVAHVIADKFVNHLPFYRQSEGLRRQGIIIGRSLMCNWAMDVGRLLEPLYLRMEKLVMNCEVMYTDETPVRVLERGKCRRAYIWVRVSGTDPPLKVYRYAPRRNQEIASELMGEYFGTYVSDACAAYNLLPGTRSACWAHARRKFFEVPTLDDPDRLEALGLIRQMYLNERQAVDAAARSQAETALVKARKACRRETRTLVEKYFQLCGRIATGGRPPSDPLVKAAAYSLNQRDELQVFLGNFHVGIDNNPAENALRPWALGRKNWLFFGNDEGGQTAAVINSMVATCEASKVSFETWLIDVLPRLATTPDKDIDILLPHLWKPQAKQD